jgi:membrane-associated phospholipid phosphatase
MRALNLWILRRGSIQANTFPSGHVAASTGAALVMLSVAPWPAGLLYGIIAAGIAIGTIAGRYHYSADVAAGAALAAIVFAVA